MTIITKGELSVARFNEHSIEVSVDSPGESEYNFINFDGWEKAVVAGDLSRVIVDTPTCEQDGLRVFFDNNPSLLRVAKEILEDDQ